MKSSESPHPPFALRGIPNEEYLVERNYIVYFILYMIIAFGIFGTVLMMTKEREYEFGILVAIGKSKAICRNVTIGYHSR